MSFSLQLNFAESELKLCISGEEDEKKKLENMRDAVETLESSVAEKSKIVSELKKKIPVSEKNLKATREELKNVKGQQARLISDIDAKRITVEEARSSMQASHSRNRIVDALMNEKKSGRCPGLFGRLVRGHTVSEL